MFMQLLLDVHSRVRLESVIAARYLLEVPSIKVVTAALENDLDPFIRYALRQSARSLPDPVGDAFPGWTDTSPI